MQQILTKSLQMKAPTDSQKAERRRTFIASTDALDRDGDIVEQDWVLDDFLANPVILFAHRSRELPVGRAENVGVVDGALQMDVVFASEKANPLAEQVYQSVMEQTLRAVSVGFLPGDVRREMRDGDDVYVFSKNRLLETSVTPIPSNPEALAKFKAMADESDLNPPWEQVQPANGGNGEVMDKQEAERIGKELDAAKAELKALRDEHKATLAKLTSAEEKAVAAAAELAKEKARADAAVRKNVETQIDALVGVKIAPAEKPTLLKLAEVSPELFKAQMEAVGSRPDMGILVDGSRLPEPPPTTKTVPSDLGGQKFDALLRSMS